MEKDKDIEDLIKQGTEITQSQKDRYDVSESRSLNILNIFQTQLDKLSKQDQIEEMILDKLKIKIENDTDPNDPIFFDDLLKASAVLSKSKNEFMTIFANVLSALQKLNKDPNEGGNGSDSGGLSAEDQAKVKNMLDKFDTFEKIVDKEF